MSAMTTPDNMAPDNNGQRSISPDEYVIQDLSRQVAEKATENSRLRAQATWLNQELQMAQEENESLKTQVKELGGELPEDGEGEVNP